MPGWGAGTAGEWEGEQETLGVQGASHALMGTWVPQGTMFVSTHPSGRSGSGLPALRKLRFGEKWSVPSVSFVNSPLGLGLKSE